MSLMFALLPLNEKADVRAATFNPYSGERVEKFFCKSVTEVLVIRIGAHVNEREDCN